MGETNKNMNDELVIEDGITYKVKRNGHVTLMVPIKEPETLTVPLVDIKICINKQAPTTPLPLTPRIAPPLRPTQRKPKSLQCCACKRNLSVKRFAKKKRGDEFPMCNDCSEKERWTIKKNKYKRGNEILCRRCKQWKPKGTHKRSCDDCLEAKWKKREVKLRQPLKIEHQSFGIHEHECIHCYSERNHNLKKLGFTDYKDYLSSVVWANVKDKVYAAKGKRCVGCGKPAIHIHHRRYRIEDLEGDTIEYLEPICKSCHKSIEYDGKSKLPVRLANDKLDRLISEKLMSLN